MKRKTLAVTAAAIAFSAISGGVIGFLAGAEQKREASAAEPAANVAVGEPQSKKPRYRLASYQGKLAVFIIGKNQPELVFDRYLHYLPDVDREKLEEGIEVADYSELMRLIEDYTS